MKSRFRPLTAVFNLMYPKLCLVCGEELMRNESQLCLSCLQAMPKTNYHAQKDNPLERKFWGKVPIRHATALFFFQKGSPFQKILHSLKYEGNFQVGQLLGAYAAQDLVTTPHYRDVDFIIPVPLHSKRYLERGYNQSEAIAKGLAEVLGKPILPTPILRKRENPTQTKKSVFERYENTAGIFELNTTVDLTGKHILLVDDVVTTGSTLEACADVLQPIEALSVSVFALAMAK